MQTRPYPFDRLPKSTRQQVQFYRRLRSLFDARQIAEALSAAGALLGGDVKLTAGGAPEVASRNRLVERLSGLGPSAFLLLQAGGAAPLDSSLVIEMSAALAELLVDRTLGGDAAQPLPPTLLPLDELSRGALSYLVARVLAALGGSVRLRDVSQRAADVAAALGDGPFMVCGFELSAGDDAGSLRLFAPLSLSIAADSGEIQRELSWLPLTLIAQIGSAGFSAAELRELKSRDVIVLDHSSLMFDGRAFAGHVMLHVAGSGTHLICRANERGLEVESLTSVKEPKMTNGRVNAEPRTTLPDVASDAPLELSVELARFSLTLGELQRTAPGDVLVTGRKIGEAVTLRVAGVAVAEGELVDVEGEVGVRIGRFLGA